MVQYKAISYTNRNTPLKITTKEINLDQCYNDKELVVEVHAGALNPIDNILKRLSVPLISGRSNKVYGFDYAGIVVRAGTNVKGYNVGDWVCGMYRKPISRAQGSLSSFLIIDPVEHSFITTIDKKGLKEPTQEIFNKNAAWPLVFTTAYSLLHKYSQNWTPNSKILVIGASTSVGYALVKLAKATLNIEAVVGICSTNSIEQNKSDGYDYLIPYDDKSKTVPQYTRDLIKEEFSGEKFDLIADCVGSDYFFSEMNTYLKPYSTNSQFLTIVGDAKLDYKTLGWREFVQFKLIFRSINIFRGYNYGFVEPGHSDCMKLGSQLIADGTFDPKIDSVFKFEEFLDAEQRLLSNKAKGKIIVEVN